ncbi:hypothetical protein PMAYCL1PPCAC_24895, partial [Pristionchus mayeri]
YIPPHRRTTTENPKREQTVIYDENKRRDVREDTMVTIDREILNDRSNAKYLIEENIRDEVYFDLAK